MIRTSSLADLRSSFVERGSLELTMEDTKLHADMAADLEHDKNTFELLLQLSKRHMRCKKTYNGLRTSCAMKSLSSRSCLAALRACSTIIAAFSASALDSILLIFANRLEFVIF